MTARKKTKHILVTGVPNFTSLKLVQKLVETETRSTIYLLVMDRYIQLATDLKKRLPERAAKRVQILAGDVTYLDMGLSGEEAGMLIDKLTHIYHLAMIWEFDVPKKICQEVNIHGTRNLLQFAAECKRLRRLLYFSTIYVSGMRRGVIREDEFWEKQAFKNNFEETRYASERLVRKQMEKGLPTTIFRLGMVVGDSQTGEMMKFDGPYLFLKLLLMTDANIPLFFPGQCEGPTNLVPVDYAVEACLHIANKDTSLGQTYHITDPYPLMTRTVFEAVCSYLGRRGPTFGLPRYLFKAVFLIPQMERFAGVPKEMFAYFNHKAVHNTSNALAALKGSGISCPRFESYFPLSIEYARDLLKRRADRIEEEETIDPYDIPSY